VDTSVYLGEPLKTLRSTYDVEWSLVSFRLVSVLWSPWLSKEARIRRDGFQGRSTPNPKARRWDKLKWSLRNSNLSRGGRINAWLYNSLVVR
jgi:hypothetical protein